MSDETISAQGRNACRRQALLTCGLLALTLVVLPWSYWRDAIDGGQFYITTLGIAGYLLLMGCVGVVLYGLVSSRRRSALPAWILIPAGALITLPLLKWVVIWFAGLELFHNRMGLGQEILGFIPNVVIDGILAAVSIGLLVLLARCSRISNNSAARESFPDQEQ